MVGVRLFPGTYQIREAEHLSSIIERAGGYTEQAYLRAAVFTRESVRELQQKRINDLTDSLELELARTASQEIQASLSAESREAQSKALASTQLLVNKLKTSKASGRVVTKLLPLEVLKGSSYDLVLKDGDTINIPPKAMTVSVLGAVYNPTSLIWDENRPEVKYYLAQVGGPAANAEEKQMYVIRADGTVISKQQTSWFGAAWDDSNKRWGLFGKSIEDAELYPGDTILVPPLIDYAYLHFLK